MEITIMELSKSYKNIKALDSLSLNLHPGIHGLLGPNGAGKTTLMRTLATILSYDNGDITDVEGNSWKKPKNIKGKIGYLPQQFGMYRYLKVKEALGSIAILKNIPREKEKIQIELALERTNLSELSERRVGQLSGGMLRRLGIAQAILGEPELLILDEPSVGLDPSERIYFRQMIREYGCGERIVLISSHIVSDLESMCGSLSIMHKGTVLANGNVSDIRKLAEGKIAQVELEERAFDVFQKNHTIISFEHKGNYFRAKYLATDGEVSEKLEANLEDTYTYIIHGGQI